jgi:drug/metabolite transporter (DMT)-like permease
VWLTPALFALFTYGLGQGLVKKYVGDVSPARFCLFFIIARSVVGLGYFVWSGEAIGFAAKAFLGWTFFVYLLDGTGWILYYKSILRGPISLVGTVSAAYPGLTVLLAAIFLGERLSPTQALGVALVLAGCLGLSYSPPEPGQAPGSKAWIGLAAAALACWGTGQTILKYAYTLPGASEAQAMLMMTLGGWLTLGLYGFVGGRSGGWSWVATQLAMVPMGLMACGDAAVIVATRYGPVSIVAPLTAAYPVVTIAFARLVLKETVSRLQYACVAATLTGMVLSSVG